MRKLSLIVLIFLSLAAPVFACDGTPVSGGGEVVIVSTTATGLTSSKYLSGYIERCALIQIRSNTIYFLLDSSTATPVATDMNGFALDILVVKRPSLFRAIRASADATLKATYFQK